MPEVLRSEFGKHPRIDGAEGHRIITPTTMSFVEGDGTDVRMSRVRVYDSEGKLVSTYLRSPLGQRYEDMPEYPDDQEYLDKLTLEEQIASADTFEELAEIALSRISKMPKPVGVVCGPITSGGKGSMEANLKEYAAQIQNLISSGKSIFSPVPYEPRMQEIKKTPYYDPSRDHLMEVFYGTIFGSGMISEFYFIPGWESSYGARWEHNFAEKIGAKIFYVDNLP